MFKRLKLKMAFKLLPSDYALHRHIKYFKSKQYLTFKRIA